MFLGAQMIHTELLFALTGVGENGKGDLAAGAPLRLCLRLIHIGRSRGSRIYQILSFAILDALAIKNIT